MLASDACAQHPWPDAKAQRWIQHQRFAVDAGRDRVVGVDFERRCGPLTPGSVHQPTACCAPPRCSHHRDPEQTVVDPRPRTRADSTAEAVAVVGDEYRRARMVRIPARVGPAQVELTAVRAEHVRHGVEQRAELRVAIAPRWTASAYRPRETLFTNTRPLISARSTLRSPPSTNASRAPTTSSRSTPRSSAKWLRVPAGTQA